MNKRLTLVARWTKVVEDERKTWSRGRHRILSGYTQLSSRRQNRPYWCRSFSARPNRAPGATAIGEIRWVMRFLIVFDDASDAAHVLSALPVNFRSGSARLVLLRCRLPQRTFWRYPTVAADGDVMGRPSASRSKTAIVSRIGGKRWWQGHSPRRQTSRLVPVARGILKMSRNRLVFCDAGLRNLHRHAQDPGHIPKSGCSRQKTTIPPSQLQPAATTATTTTIARVRSSSSNGRMTFASNLEHSIRCWPHRRIGLPVCQFRKRGAFGKIRHFETSQPKMPQGRWAVVWHAAPMVTRIPVSLAPCFDAHAVCARDGGADRLSRDAGQRADRT